MDAVRAKLSSEWTSNPLHFSISGNLPVTQVLHPVQSCTLHRMPWLHTTQLCTLQKDAAP